MEKLVKNKKGDFMTSIQWAIGIIMLLYAIGFFLDITLIGQKMYATTAANNQLCRIASVQGGVLGAAPQGYPDNYVSSGDMNSYLQRALGNIQITNYEARINGAGIPSAEIPYRGNVDTTITIHYDWNFMNRMLPGNWTNKTFTSYRSGISEWKYDYSDWGEN